MPGHRVSNQAPERLGDTMVKAREIASRFGRLRVHLDTAADYGAAPVNTFESGLQAIDGLSNARSSTRRGRPALSRKRTGEHAGHTTHHVRRR
jgi:hypothetical protein